MILLSSFAERRRQSVFISVKVESKYNGVTYISGHEDAQS